MNLIEEKNNLYSFSEIINRLNQFWTSQGCSLLNPYVSEVGAGTLAPATILSCLSENNYSACYVQPSIRPADSRYGKNINRLYMHHQYQVIIKKPDVFIDVQNLYLRSLHAIGLDFSKNDLRFIEDDWKNASIGAFGLGWEVWLNGTEVTQFTFMQTLGGVSLDIVPVEITYGLERLVMCMQQVDSVFDIIYDQHGRTYGQIFSQNEYDFSCLALEQSDLEMLRRHLVDFQQQAKRLFTLGNLKASYDYITKASHCLNLLDARHALSLNERTDLLLNLKDLVKNIALHLKDNINKMRV